MASNDFKTAAAKLLAQHSAKKQENQSPRPVHSVHQASPSSPSSQGRSRQSAGSELAPLVRGAAIPVLAMLGCAIMVLVVPETIFGMWFNVVFGILSGAIFGLIIIREL